MNCGLDLVQHLQRILALCRIQRREWVKEPFVVPRGQQAPLHTELVHGAGKPEAIHEHTDGTADDTRLVYEDTISSHRVVPAGSADIVDHDYSGTLGQTTQAPDFFDRPAWTGLPPDC
jgi:hypothetical protein